MSDPVLHSHIDKWLAAHPAQRLSLAFIAPDRRDPYLAMAALQQELVTAAHDIRESQVAATKLHWWGEELSGAAVSGGRHPLVQALFADAAVRTIEPDLWLAPVMAGVKQLDAATASDFTGQLEMAESFHGALAALDTRLWFGPEADPAHAARIASLDHLMHALTRLNENAHAERLPLPMSRLARHGLDRESLTLDSDARRQAVRAQIDDLLQAWHDAPRLPGPLSSFRGLDERLGRHWLHQARRATDPLDRLRGVQRRQTGFTPLRHAWSAARASRRVRPGTGID